MKGSELRDKELDMKVECDCGLIFTDKQLVITDDGAVNWMCPNCGDCKEWF